MIYEPHRLVALECGAKRLTFVKLSGIGFLMEFVLESNFFRRKVFVLFIAFSKRSHWADLSLLEQRKIDRAKNDQSFTSFEYKNPNKILKTLKAKISGRAMIQVASTYG